MEPTKTPPAATTAKIDAADEVGIGLQRDEPSSPEELLLRLTELGLEVDEVTLVGFEPEIDRSAPVPTAAEGAPVVSDARLLRARRRGEATLNGGVDHPRAVEAVKRYAAALARHREPKH
jgi:hypothetical protein